MNEQDDIKERVKKMYAIICNATGGDGPGAVQDRINLIRDMERITKTRFSNTKHFHQKVGEYLARTPA